MFINGDAPGIIYLPKPGAPPAATEIKPVMPESKSNAWFGLGAKAGTQFVVVAIETMTGYVVSLDGIGKGMVVIASVNRLGPGIGASGGACFIYITGVSSPDVLNGHQQMDSDFNVSLGGNWSKVANLPERQKNYNP